MFDEYDFEENTTQDMEMEHQMDLIRERLIYANWELIKKNGIDIVKVDNVPLLIDTLTQMLEYFEEEEEYEKCAVINEYLKQL